MQSWYQSLQRLVTWVGRAAAQAVKRRPLYRPKVEGLEDRQVPSGASSSSLPSILIEGQHIKVATRKVLSEVQRKTAATIVGGQNVPQGTAIAVKPDPGGVRPAIDANGPLPGTGSYVNSDGERVRIRVRLEKDPDAPNGVVVVLRQNHTFDRHGNFKLTIIIPRLRYTLGPWKIALHAGQPGKPGPSIGFGGGFGGVFGGTFGGGGVGFGG
jgi:hypothetical protein